MANLGWAFHFQWDLWEQPQLIQAGTLMALILPLILFAVAQRFFVQGIVITGVEK